MNVGSITIAVVPGLAKPEPGIHEHRRIAECIAGSTRPSGTVFLGSGFGAARRPGMTGKNA